MNKSKLEQLENLLNKFENIENYFTTEEREFALKNYDIRIGDLMFQMIKSCSWDNAYNNMCCDYRALTKGLRK